MNYSMIIRWSDEDEAYIVSFPEWEAVGHIGHAHGKTYREAAQQGEELLENLVEWAKQDGEAAPPPDTFTAATVHPTPPAYGGPTVEQGRRGSDEGFHIEAPGAQLCAPTAAERITRTA